MMRFWIYIACCVLASDVVLSTPYQAVTGSKRALANANNNVPVLIAIAGDKDAADDDDDPKRLVCYFNFETRPESKSKITVIVDKSGYDNNGDFSLGGEILKYTDPTFTCNQAARLWNSDIIFKGDLFQAKPRKAVTIAAWIRLEEKPGSHSIFDTIGVSHNQGQYHFEINNGIVRWFHRNENRVTVFETMAHEVQKEKWTHVAGTYDSCTKQAKIFIDGTIKNQTLASGCYVSRDWASRAGIGNHLKHRPLRGSVDEFRIYNYALKPDEIRALVGACQSGDSTANTGTTVERSTTADQIEVKKDVDKRSLWRRKRDAEELLKVCTNQ